MWLSLSKMVSCSADSRMLYKRYFSEGMGDKTYEMESEIKWVSAVPRPSELGSVHFHNDSSVYGRPIYEGVLFII